MINLRLLQMHEVLSVLVAKMRGRKFDSHSGREIFLSSLYFLMISNERILKINFIGQIERNNLGDRNLLIAD